MSGHAPGAGRRSRPWAVTGGRIQALAADSDIRLDTHVTACPHPAALPSGSAHLRILELCRTSRAVAELAAELGVPVGIAGAMVAQLRDDGHVETRAPLDLTHDGVVTDALLRRVRDGLLNAI